MFTSNSTLLSRDITTIITNSFGAIGNIFDRTLNQIIKSLFSNNEQGFAYDPNDLSTMFQDAAGTVPVTAAGQPVGLIKDKSGRNNHAYQLTSASRPILEQTPILGDELVVNGDTSNGTDGWITTNATLQTIDGSFVVNASAQYGGVTNLISLDTSKTYELTFTVTGNTTNAPLTALIRPVSTTTNYAQVGITTAGKYKLTFKPTAVSSRFMLQHGSAAPTGSVSFTNVSIKEITGYRTDQNYLAFDGADDFLQTNNIDFTATDKLSLFAGLRKMSDAARSMVIELSPSTNIGTFRLEAPNAVSSGNILYSSGGSMAGGGIAAIGGFNAPISIVATGKSDIAQDITELRINGNLVATGRTDQGTGNYGNYPLYIGRRGGTSLPFNGHIYSLIGIGRLTTDSETIALEKAIAKIQGWH